MDLAFRRATLSDVETIVELVNSAYRGESSRAGWTTEADYLEGARTDTSEIASLVSRSDSVFLLAELSGDVVGTVLLQHDGAQGYLGMFVVRPDLQGSGIGSAFMRAAEDVVRAEWDPPSMWMSVLSLRAELIAYYERRGYRRTGRFIPFPSQSLSTPLVPDLKFEVMEKDLR